MSLRNSPLFDPDGKGTPLLFGQLRRRMPAQPVQSRAVLVEQGMATAYFRSWWRAAFPSRQPLPQEAIARRDGVASDEFWTLLA